VSTATAQRVASLQFPGIRFGALPAEPVRRLATGIDPLDALLGGGLPRGYVSEVVGGPSSGRTALLHALLASATRRGEVAAVVDLPDALDPPSLARAGADLGRVLWVRPPSPQTALKCAELILSAGGFGLVVLDGLEARRTRPLPPQVWPRLAQVTRRAGAACLLCAPQRLAGGAAAMALTLAPQQVRWSGHLFEGITTTAVLARTRFGAAERAIELMFGTVARPPVGGGAPSPPGRGGARPEHRGKGGGEEAVRHAITG
jgi:hypothetical protein